MDISKEDDTSLAATKTMLMMCLLLSHRLFQAFCVVIYYNFF